MRVKLGSLFDGSGGFPLAAELCGITPVWASEIEPYPIAVTKSRFPQMKHIGDISKVNGTEIEPVDIITFGSPCQDLSVAGKRAGLKHEDNGDEETTRSGLFMEAVRIIKEMRSATDGKYPTFALWENVPGAFSSNKGEDFRIVLEELVKIIEPGAKMPAPDTKWPYADCYVGDGWSIAYRTFDAQYWGVPQRRRRIYLVADFRGQRAGEILFKHEGLRGYFETGRTPWEGTATDVGGSPTATDRTGKHIESCIPINTMIATRHKQLGRGTGFGVGEEGNPQFTISAGHEHAVCYREIILDDQGGSCINIRTDGVAPTIRAEMHGKVPCVLEAAGFKAGQSMAGSIGYQKECAATLSAQASGTEPTVCIKYTLAVENHPADSRVNIDASGKCQTLTSRMGTGGGNVPLVLCMATQQGGAEIAENLCPTITAAAGMSGNNQPVICLQGNGIDRADTAGCNGKGWKEDICYTLNTIDRPAVAYAMQGFGDYKESDISSGLKARDYKDATDLVVECAGVDCRNMREYHELYPTLQAKPNGGQSLNFSGAVRIRYIVRRLTPTECARLQGFPDEWGRPDYKDDLTDEEYQFWQGVRSTSAIINGKTAKEYTKEQLLKWYNKLHTDSAEYKMWGNGIALPCALYVMQGIEDIYKEEKQ